MLPGSSESVHPGKTSVVGRGRRLCACGRGRPEPAAVATELGGVAARVCRDDPAPAPLTPRQNPEGWSWCKPWRPAQSQHRPARDRSMPPVFNTTSSGARLHGPSNPMASPNDTTSAQLRFWSQQQRGSPADSCLSMTWSPRNDHQSKHMLTMGGASNSSPQSSCQPNRALGQRTRLRHCREQSGPWCWVCVGD